MSADRPLIGGHVSTRGGIDKAVDNAQRIGAEVFQTHPTPAQTWTPLRLDDIVLGVYKEKFARAGLRGHYLHAVYLVNLASPKASLVKQSVGSLVHYMQLAERLEADGVVFHPGSHLGAGFEAMLPQMGAALREVVVRSATTRPLLLVENSAGSGGCIGCSLEEVARIVEGAASDRVAVCSTRSPADTTCTPPKVWRTRSPSSTVSSDSTTWRSCTPTIRGVSWAAMSTATPT